MVTDFVEQFAKMIANYPEDVQVEANEGNEKIEIVLHANQADVGKLIGHYNPMNEEKTLVVDNERLDYWLSVGAKMSDRVKKITGR